MISLTFIQIYFKTADGMQSRGHTSFKFEIKSCVIISSSSLFKLWKRIEFNTSDDFINQFNAVRVTYTQAYIQSFDFASFVPIRLNILFTKRVKLWIWKLTVIKTKIPTEVLISLKVYQLKFCLPHDNQDHPVSSEFLFS